MFASIVKHLVPPLSILVWWLVLWSWLSLMFVFRRDSMKLLRIFWKLQPPGNDPQLEEALSSHRERINTEKSKHTDTMSAWSEKRRGEGKTVDRHVIWLSLLAAALSRVAAQWLRGRWMREAGDQRNHRWALFFFCATAFYIKDFYIQILSMILNIHFSNKLCSFQYQWH